MFVSMFPLPVSRLVLSIIGLTMVPPTLIGSLRTIAEFRGDWTRDLQKLRRNLITGVTHGELWDPVREVGRTPFYLAHQGGPDLEMMSSLAGVYDAAAPSLRYMAPHCRGGTGEEGEAAKKTNLAKRPIRIGQEEDSEQNSIVVVLLLLTQLNFSLCV